MHTLSDREIIIDLELLLCAKLRPTFIASNVSEDYENTIEIVISCTQFGNKRIEDRVHIIFNLLSWHFPDILEERLVIVSALSNPEIDDILDDIFSKEIF